MGGKWHQFGPDCTQCGKPQLAKGLCNTCYKRERRKMRREQLPLCPNEARGWHSWSAKGNCLRCGAVKPPKWDESKTTIAWRAARRRALLPMCPNNVHGRHKWAGTDTCVACKVVKPRGWW